MTYSIVARDPDTGQVGVAVQSHYFSVGPIVPWCEAGVGAVATQALVDVSYGPLGLDLMRLGKPSGDSLKALIAGDEHSAVRQVAMVDCSGEVATHTGESCISEAGHQTGEGFSVQANMMEKSTVWGAMADAFTKSKGSLAARMLDALDAAQAEGGDIRGKQSAAMVIVAAESTGKPWVDRLFDLRVEDHPDPLVELRRLVDLQTAYRRVGAAEELLVAGQEEEALREYEAALESGRNVELEFWHALSLARRGKVAEAKQVLSPIFLEDPRWAELLRRLPPAGLFPDDEELLKDLIEG